MQIGRIVLRSFKVELLQSAAFLKGSRPKSCLWCQLIDCRTLVSNPCEGIAFFESKKKRSSTARQQVRLSPHLLALRPNLGGRHWFFGEPGPRDKRLHRFAPVSPCKCCCGRWQPLNSKIRPPERRPKKATKVDRGSAQRPIHSM